MNPLIHGIGADPSAEARPPVRIGLDALPGRHGECDVVLSNPPFGRKASVSIVGKEGAPQRESLVMNRDDFWATTRNRQLNLLQHLLSVLKTHGRAAVVVPGNDLVEGGPGETIRRRRLAQADLHALPRLPTGALYTQGFKASVRSFERRPARDAPWTERLWIDDRRTNQRFTLKTNPLKPADLDDFVAANNPANRHVRTETERFHSFAHEELTRRDRANLDILSLNDESLEDSASLPAPGLLAAGITEDLQAALEQLALTAEDLALYPTPAPAG